MSLGEVNYGSFKPEDFDNFIHGQMRRVALAQNGEVVGIHHPDNTNLWEDGSNVNWTEYENNGWNCMVQIPKFYYRTFRDTYKGLDTYRCEIATSQRDGFKLHPAFIRNGIERDFQYMSAFEGWLDGRGRLRSLPNKTVTAGRTISQFRSDAFQNGNNFTQQEIYLTSAIQMLYLVEYGGFDAQRLLAEGNISSSYVNTGLSLSLGNKSGGTNTWMSYRGIENFYANYWKVLDGLNIRERQVYIATDTNFESDKFSGNYINTGFIAPTSGYISDFGFNSGFDYLFIPTASDGSDSVALSDYVWTTAGDMVAAFGGFHGYDFNCGCFALNLRFDSANAGPARAARLEYI